MKVILLLALTACGDDLTVERTRPDAGRRYRDAALDASVDATADAAFDAPACWQYKSFQCDNLIYNVCIPYTGCSETFECHGSTMAYCGPGVP